MRIAVINPSTSEPVTSHILAAAREVAGVAASLVAFTAAGAFAYPEPLPYAGMTAPSQVVGKHPLADAP
jgi:hypothetical protein